ncbi:MAG TPA: hypothetical protein DCP56_03205, partial [Spirochaetaceae bacterium]|nr:hypothetical protein [Spirochaetaceae bacterium]
PTRCWSAYSAVFVSASEEAPARQAATGALSRKCQSARTLKTTARRRKAPNRVSEKAQKIRRD